MANTSLLGSYGGQDNSALMFRNRLVNGAMTIDQRNAGAAVTPTNGQYTLDRWRAGLAQASKFTVQQSSVAPAGFTNSLLVTSSSAYSVGASEAFNIAQFIEGFNVADLGWGTAAAQSVTLSFWVRSSLTGIFGGSIQNDGVNRSYPFTYSISAANTWEYKTVTIAGDTTGTWLTNSGIGMRVWWSLGTGASASSAAGSWAAGDFRSATGATSVVGTNGATLYITGASLEAGPTATPFERRPIGVEQSLCERYYEKGTYSGNLTTYSNGNIYTTLYCKTTKRTAVQISFSNATTVVYTAAQGGVTGTNSADNLDTKGFRLVITAALSTWVPCHISLVDWIASAEL